MNGLNYTLAISSFIVMYRCQAQRSSIRISGVPQGKNFTTSSNRSPNYLLDPADPFFRPLLPYLSTQVHALRFIVLYPNATKCIATASERKGRQPSLPAVSDAAESTGCNQMNKGR